MNPRNTGLLLIVALALGAFLYFYEIEGEEQRKEAAQATKKVFPGLESEGVTRIEVTAGDGTPAVLERDEGGWRVREPVDFPGDEATLDGMASTLSGLTSEAVIEEPQAPDVYGLGDSAEVLRFQADGEGRELRVGSKTPVGSNSYVSRDGDERVFMVPSWRINSLHKELVDLRDRSVLDFDRATIDRLDASWRGGSVSLVKRDGNWWIREPIEGKADDDTVDDLLSDLAFLRADGFEDDPPPDSETGLDAPEFAAVLRGADDAGVESEVRFALGSLVDGGERLARGRTSALYRVAGERLSELPRSLVDYRFKNVSSFEISDVRRFELSFLDGDDRSVVEGKLEDSGWQTTPEPMASDMAANLVSELSRLKGVDILADDASQEDLAAHGLAPARVEIRLWADADAAADSEPLAHVAVGSVDDDGIVARAVGGPQVYRLDGDLAEHIPVSLEAFQNRFVGEEAPAEPVDVPDDMSVAPEP